MYAATWQCAGRKNSRQFKEEYQAWQWLVKCARRKAKRDQDASPVVFDYPEDAFVNVSFEAYDYGWITEKTLLSVFADMTHTEGAEWVGTVRRVRAPRPTGEF